jgi:hypothetical protein
MKNKYYLVCILIFSFFISCSKDDITATSAEQILTSGVWKIDEIRFLQSNTQFLYYKRGNTSGNTANYDTESIKFNTDKTGTYIAGGISYTLTWDFADATKNKLLFTIAYSTPLLVTWENIIYSETDLRYSEYYNRNGNLSMGVATRKH